jgi:signal transduction histidine kinase
MPPQRPNPSEDLHVDASASDLVWGGAGEWANKRPDELTVALANQKPNRSSVNPDYGIHPDTEGRNPESVAPAFERTGRTDLPRETEHSQSLRSKLVLSLAMMLAVVVGIDEIVRQKVIAPEFANLERVAALKDTNRVLSAINTEVGFLAETAAHNVRQYGHGWRPFDRPQDGATETDPGRSIRHASGHRIEWEALVTTEGRWDWISIDPSATDGPIEPESLNRSRGKFPRITEIVAQHSSPDSLALRGMTQSSEGELYLFAALPLQPTAGDSSGQSIDSFYVVGQRFGKDVVSDIEQRISVGFAVQPLQKAEKLQGQVEIDAEGRSFLFVKSPLVSPTGRALGHINVRLPRDVTNRSDRTTAFARYLSMCGACGSLLLLLLLLQRIVIGRLEMIRLHTERIAQSGIISEETMSPVLRVGTRDEIGQLAESFDRMRTRLGDAQQRLSDASHAAGMSLVADTVIHNVGNVLTNVNSLIETATRRVENLRIEPLEKLAERLRSNHVDEAFQRATPDYLQRLSETLEDDKDDLAALLHTLNDNVRHIHQVIRDQRRHANQPVKWNQVDVSSIVNDAVRCSNARLEQDNVRVHFDLDFDVQIWTDRSLLLQILINVIGNAGYAIRDVKNRQPTLTIDLSRTESTVQIRLRDNGCGMDAVTLSRVFDAHFTTRKTGSGLGLHFCAIAIKRIGGAIHAESDGPDRGATFIVEVPLMKLCTDNGTPRMLVGPSAEMTAIGSKVLAGSGESPSGH